MAIPAPLEPAKVLELADEKTIREVTGAPVGFAGPVGIKCPVIADHDVPVIVNAITGANAADAHKVDWCPCDAPNEVGFLHHWLTSLMPSIHALQLTPEQLRSVTAPVLTIHGTLDRQSPYGAGLEWSQSLGNARLLTIPDAAHVPWIEAPDEVFGAIRTFLGGEWPLI